jgi:hypothetical protein
MKGYWVENASTLCNKCYQDLFPAPPRDLHVVRTERGVCRSCGTKWGMEPIEAAEAAIKCLERNLRGVTGPWITVFDHVECWQISVRLQEQRGASPKDGQERWEVFTYAAGTMLVVPGPVGEPQIHTERARISLARLRNWLAATRVNDTMQYLAD